MNTIQITPDEPRSPEATPKVALLASALDGNQAWHALKANRRLVLAVGSSVFALVMGVTLLSRMEFQVSGRLYLGELEGRLQTTSINDLTNTGTGDVYSEIEIMRSRSRVEQSVLASGLNVTIEPVGWSAPRYWRWLLSRRDPSILDVSFRQLRAVNTSLPARARDSRRFGIEFSDERSYSVFDDKGAKLSSAGLLDTPLSVDGVTLTLLPGSAASPRKGAKYGLEIAPTEKTVDEALRKLEIVLPKAPAAALEPMKVLSLELTSTAPNQAAAFLRSLLEAYLHERQAWKTEDATAAETVVTKQLAGIQNSLNDTERKIADFKIKNQSVVEQTQPQSMVAQLATYEQQRTAARLQASMFENVVTKLTRPNLPIETFMFGEADDPVLHELGTALAESRETLADLDSKFNAAAPDVKQQRAKVGVQLSMIRSYVTSRLSRAREQVKELDGVIAQYEAKLAGVPTAQLALGQIERESEVYSRMYSYLLESQQRTAIAKAATGSKNRILDWPQVPVRESGPNLALRLASGLLGLLLGCMLVVARSMSSGSFHSEAEVRSALGVTTVFASVPRQPRQRALPSGKSSPPLFDLMALPFDSSGFAEAFRTLRTNLYYALPEPHGKVILITSPSPGDGKTTTSLCLAAILAADSKRVLLVDADLRKPSHYLMTHHWPEPGLRGVLTGNASEKSVTHTVRLTRGSFDSLDSGFGVPTELLSSPRFSSLLIRARHHYDYILLDSPSYPLVADPLILANLSDFVVSVVRLGNTPRSTAEEHVRGLFSRARGHALLVNGSNAAAAYGYPSAPHPLPRAYDHMLEAENARRESEAEAESKRA